MHRPVDVSAELAKINELKATRNVSHGTTLPISEVRSCFKLDREKTLTFMVKSPVGLQRGEFNVYPESLKKNEFWATLTFKDTNGNMDFYAVEVMKSHILACRFILGKRVSIKIKFDEMLFLATKLPDNEK